MMINALDQGKESGIRDVVFKLVELHEIFVDHNRLLLEKAFQMTEKITCLEAKISATEQSYACLKVSHIELTSS